MSGRRPVVTVDGPAGAGKSTASRELARRLGYIYLDTGAIYRSVALATGRALPEVARKLDAGGEPGALDEKECEVLGDLAQGLDLRFAGAGTRVILDGVDVSAELRTPEISQRASRVSAIPAVRRALLDVQRRIGAEGGVVAEGRDTGSVVFPRAEVKFFLVADPRERARRRAAELRASGVAADEAATLAEILARDARDEPRAAAPLTQPKDATVIDTSSLAPDAVVAFMLDAVTARHRS
jgi:cytidylate kinase